MVAAKRIKQTPQTFAEIEQAPPTLSKKINKVLADFGENVNIGIMVQNLNTGKVIYKRNADRLFYAGK